jgi:hypothetical protein
LARTWIDASAADRGRPCRARGGQEIGEVLCIANSSNIPSSQFTAVVLLIADCGERFEQQKRSFSPLVNAESFTELDITLMINI